MKRIHIIAIIAIAVAVATLTLAAGETAKYGDFSQARQNAEKIKIVGKLCKDKPMHYDPIKDPNAFSFYIKDQNEEIHQVLLNREKPQDFELSEQIVVTGKMEGNIFKATDILMKCPSKYKDEEIAIKK